MNQQARILLASAICMGLVVGYGEYASRNMPPATEDASSKNESSAARSRAEQADSETRTERVAASSESSGTPAAAPQGSLSKFELHNEVLALELENSPGGILRKLALTDEQFRLAGEEKGLDFLHLGSGASLEFRLGGEDRNVEVPRDFSEISERSEKKVVLRRQNADVEIVETLTLGAGYQASYDVTVTNRSGHALSYSPMIAMRLGIDEEKLNNYNTARGVSWGEEGLEDTDWSDTDDEDETHKGPLRWFGLDSKYFLAAVVGKEELKRNVVSRVESADGKWLMAKGEGLAVDLSPGASTTHRYGLFLGPKLVEALEAFDVIEDAQLGQAQDWGFFGSLSKVLGKGLLWLLRWFHEVTGVWGLAIVLLTVAVKAVTLPLTLKQFASMRRMRDLQPEIAVLRERYGDDKMKMNQEMQALFARMGVNPFASCLPMLVQLPVWFALYSMIGAAVELYNQPFLWLNDLSLADPYYILPVVAGAMSWVQMHMQPAAGDPQQQAVMKWMFPGMFLFMTLVLPSGLGVYMVANSGLSLIQSYIQLRPAKKSASLAT
jgi:YidC/Oxa1 family membrane protein insertase